MYRTHTDKQVGWDYMHAYTDLLQKIHQILPVVLENKIWRYFDPAGILKLIKL